MKPWDQHPNPGEAVEDHFKNPEYEAHIGQVASDGKRYVSIWLRGVRWSGWLREYHPPVQ